MKELFEEIENQSEFVFVYYDGLIDLDKEISIDVSNKTVDKILRKVFKLTDKTYRIYDRQIVIGKKDPITNDIILESPGNNKLEQQNKIKGKVTDNDNKPMPGVTITILGTTRGVITDNDGTYSIEANSGDRLVFSFIGMESQVIDVGNETKINVQLEPKTQELEDVTIVAFGKQKKESVISSIETVKTDELRVPSSNLTTALAGRMSGVISYQTSGEPGEDNAEFFIRGVTSFGTGKVDPLILVDNVEVSSDDLSRLHPDDIASFSILKDATATALYGARGANGVVLVTTKEGTEGKMKVSVRFENSFSSPTQEIQMADPIIYMKLANEAAKTRDPLAANTYSNTKIENTINQTNPYVYPAVDWMDMLTKDLSINQRANLNISGGGKVARYYIAGSFSQDNGILDVDKRNNFNSNIDLKKYLIRSNININLTKSTEAVVRVHGTFEDYIGPMTGGSAMYKKMLRVSPARFPAYYEPDETYAYEQHILFGNDGDGTYLNPYAELVSGYKESSESVMMAQFELKQDFGQWIDGLTGRILGNTQRYSFFDVERAYQPFYYSVGSYDRYTDIYNLTELNTEDGTEYLSYEPGNKTITSTFYSEASLAYKKQFGKNDISGMLVGMARNALTANASTLSESLPERNLGLSGRFTYAYDAKYMAEFNFGYNGSEKFDKGHRWGFFPSFGLGWMASNETFWQNNLKNIINKLKIKATYGLVGNDDIGTERFFYLSDVTIEGGNSFTSGYDYGYSRSGTSINNYANSNIGWEIAYKSNLGIEMGLFNGKIDINADLFHEYRTNILQERADIPSTMGLWDTPTVNVGEATGKGIDVSADYNQTFRNGIWLVGRANFTYARSLYKQYEEPDYSDIPWKSKINRPIKQTWGYYAERLFIDAADVENSARQDFGEYGPGDIKYKDMNGDGVINSSDKVPLGLPTTPEINYGFGLSAGYKNFDFSFFFQGSARSSFWIGASTMSPFVESTSDGKILETGLAQFIADDYWSESSQNPYAVWPRLSNYEIENNTVASSWFMRNGAFLRLKSLEFGYSLPQKVTDKLNLKTCRVYVSGTNLFKISDFKIWDVEMGSNGLGYPLQRVINLGINVAF
ncbi:TonB-dependent receptor [Maribellus maritimus]|uniref:TonB-dependent receptor n=1 Tax=Maribellus maritimus TaxID=2870838 RepID=UPI001EEAE747|nr:TonB-dependent receptor [Maribellus maritimus]MCG6188598.1 TonB-dependent receptor [Maribellus maritimus]